MYSIGQKFSSVFKHFPLNTYRRSLEKSLHQLIVYMLTTLYVEMFTQFHIIKNISHYRQTFPFKYIHKVITLYIQIAFGRYKTSVLKLRCQRWYFEDFIQQRNMHREIHIKRLFLVVEPLRSGCPPLELSDSKKFQFFDRLEIV